MHNVIKKLVIGSWNINRISDKVDDIDFLNVIKQYDIIALNETWLSPDENIEVDGYYAYSSSRNKSTSAFSYSGGIAFLIKNSFKKCIKIIDYRSDFIVWIKIESKYTNLGKDLYIAAVYIPPANSSYYLKKPEPNPFEELESCVNKYLSKGEVLIIGDLNARTGRLPDFIVNDSSKYLPIKDQGLPYPTDLPMSPRLNEDKVVNSFGRKLTEMCQSVGLRILNGRKMGDLHGSITCYKYNGKSLVDYGISSATIFEQIDYFKVLTSEDVLDTTLSDHYPIKISLSCSLNNKIDKPPDHLEDMPPIFIWNKSSTIAFQNAFTNENIQKKLRDLQNIKKDKAFINIDEYNNKIVDLFVSAASKSLKCRQSIHKEKKVKRKKWYDKNVWELKKEIQILKKCIREGNSNPLTIGRYSLIKKHYRKLVKQNNRAFKSELMKKVESIVSRDPKTAWKLINELKAAKSKDADIDIEKLVKHFENLGNHRSEHFNKEYDAKIHKALSELKSNNKIIDILDKEITMSELTNCAKQLKNGKSVGQDRVSNEMIKCSLTLVGPILLNFFNTILQFQKTPIMWGSGWIVPIYKSGPTDDPKNYRPITVTSCISKLFTLILNSRLITFLDKYNIINDYQIGFRKNSRTTDHIFLLKTIIDYYKKKHKHIYACFVDFSSAFPSIWRSGLFYKLYQSGLSSKFINIMASLYSHTVCSVKLKGKLSKQFSIKIGTKQGCNLSPSLFNLFTNDIPGTLLNSKMDPVKLFGREIPLLMYADDIVILSQSGKGLQHALDALGLYCKNWKLTVNIKKTKVVVFNSRVSSTADFRIMGKIIERTTSYTYLGIIFTCSGKFTRAMETLKIKAKKVWFALSRSFNTWEGTPAKILLKLFSSMVQPILLYGSEIWGSYLYRKIDSMAFENIIFNTKLGFETLHLQICKQILGINKKSSNISTLGELGRFPLILNVLKSVFSYLVRILHFPHSSLINTALKAHKEILVGPLSFLQLPKIANKEVKYHFAIFESNILTKTKLTTESRKILDKLQTLFKYYFPKLVQNNNKLELYFKVKKQFRFENYINFVANVQHRIAITKFRTSTHNLPIETGRYKNTPKEERYCIMCKENKIGNEKHVLFECTNKAIQDSRNKLLRKIQSLVPVFETFKNNDKLVYILSCSDRDITKEIGRFLGECLNLHRNVK